MAEVIKRSDISEKDIYGGVRTSAEQALKQVDKLNDSLRETAKVSKKQLDQSFRLSNSREIKEAEKQIKLSNKAMTEAIKLDNEKIKLEAQRLKAERLLNKEVERTAREQEKQNKAVKDLNDEYKKLVRSTRDLKNESKRLGAELLHLETTGRKNTKEYRLLERQYKDTTASAVVLDRQLKKIDSRVGDNFRNVGNYSKAVNGLKGALTQLGLSFGVFQVTKFGKGAIVDFESAVADLSAITGQTGKQLDFLEQKAIDFSKQFGGSAKDVVEAFKLAGSARPELLKNGEALAELTEQALILSKASRDDVPTSIANLTTALNAFELPSDRAGELIDVLANAAQKGAKEIPFLSDAFTKFGAVAANADVTIQESAAAVELLGEKIPEASIAGTNLRNILLILQTEAAKQGREFQGLIKELELLKPQLNDVTSLQKTFGKENILATQILISQTDRLKDFSSQLNETGTAQKQAEVNSNTLSEAWNRLKANFESLFLDLRDSTISISSILGFLANNLKTIVSVLGTLVKGFLAYKTIIIGIKTAQTLFNKELRNSVFGFKNLTNSVKNADGSVNKFGNSLKTIGLSAFIGLLTELALEFFDVASGAADARFELERFNRSVKQGEEFGRESVERIEKSFKTRKQEIDLTRAQGKITREEAKAQLKALNERIDRQIIGEIRLANENKKRFASDQAIVAKENETLKQLIALQKRRKDLAIQTTITQLDNNRSLDVSNKVISKNTKEIQENINAQEEWIQSRIDLSEIEEQEIERTGLFEDDIIKAQQSIEERRKNIAEIKVLNAELLGDEEALKKARIEQIKELRDIELENEELTGTERERIRKEAQLKINKINEEGKNQQIKNTKELISIVGDLFEKQTNQRIEQLDKQKSAAENQYDFLKQLAAEGNITAQQSLAEQQKIINEANKQKIQEQKNLEKIKLAESALSTYNNKVDNGDDQPLVSTVTDITLLRQFISSLPAFKEGTEDTGKHGLGIDGQGGFHAILHDGERVMTKEENKKMGKISNESVSNIVHDFKTGKLVDINQKQIDKAGNSFDLLPMIKEIKNLNKTIENKPVTNIELGEITQSLMQIIERTKKGNTIERKIFNIRK